MGQQKKRKGTCLPVYCLIAYINLLNTQKWASRKTQFRIDYDAPGLALAPTWLNNRQL